MRVDAVDMRLGTVEQVLVAKVTEARASTQLVMHHGHRLDGLETR